MATDTPSGGDAETYLSGRRNALQKGARPAVPSPDSTNRVAYWFDQGVRDVFANRASRVGYEALFYDAGGRPLPITFRSATGTSGPIVRQAPAAGQPTGNGVYIPPPGVVPQYMPQIGPNSAYQGLSADSMAIGPFGEVTPLWVLFSALGRGLPPF